MWVKWSAVSTAAILLIFFVFTIYSAATQPDTQCTTTHTTTSQPPAHLLTAMDYFLQGDYEYDRGNCKQAIAAYTRSIQLNPNYPESYNNRAYTYMRMQDYKDALPDLDKALSLNQNYVQALMNRGDLYNYYGPIINRHKAIEDYDKVIALGGTHSTSVCGHKAMAESNGILPFAFLRFFTNPGC